MIVVTGNASVSFNSQDQEILDISEEFQSPEKTESQPLQYIRSNGDNESCIVGYFCSNSVFSLKGSYGSKTKCFRKGL